MIWKDIKGYEGIYQINTEGDVRSLDREIIRGGSVVKISSVIIKSRMSNAGYYRITLSNNDTGTTFSVHRLVAETFVDNPNNKPCVNHINGLKTDNKVDNLEWVTQKENIRHAKDVLGKNIGDASKLIHLKGFDHPGAKFTTGTLKELIAMRSEGVSFGKLAKYFNVDKSTVQSILKGETWSSVTGIVKA